ncbi:hypothetical protein FQ762_27545 [Streptomyces coelicolor A3(2)]|nr:hypothetical protein FQ762_27545 [Streptomyces coelicolor A3(2)]
MTEKIPGSLFIILPYCIQNAVEKRGQHEEAFLSPIVREMPNHAGVNIDRNIVSYVYVHKIESPLAAPDAVVFRNSHKPPRVSKQGSQS